MKNITYRINHLDNSLDQVRSFATNSMLAGDCNVDNGPWLGSSKTNCTRGLLRGHLCHAWTCATRQDTDQGNNPLDLILSYLEDRVSLDVTSPSGRSDQSVLLSGTLTAGTPIEN